MNLPMVQHDVSDIERMARAIASSKLFGVTSPEQAIALCLIAQAEGRHPASAAQDYHIISGRPSKKADAMLRDFLSAGGKVEWHALDDATADATFSHPAGGKVRIAWDMGRAAQAGIKNPMWTKYPRQMLRARVVSEGVRTVYPMATSGMYVPEEVQEFDAPSSPVPPMIEGTSGESAKPSKDADARGLYSKHEGAIRGAADKDELHNAWQAALADKDKFTVDWQRSLRAELDGRLADLDRPSADDIGGDDGSPFDNRDYVGPGESLDRQFGHAA